MRISFIANDMQILWRRLLAARRAKVIIMVARWTTGKTQNCSQWQSCLLNNRLNASFDVSAECSEMWRRTSVAHTSFYFVSSRQLSCFAEAITSVAQTSFDITSSQSGEERDSRLCRECFF